MLGSFSSSPATSERSGVSCEITGLIRTLNHTGHPTHVSGLAQGSQRVRGICVLATEILPSASRPRWVMRLLPQSTEGDGAADDITIDRLSPRHFDICLERACDLGRHWVWSFRERLQREQGEVTRKQIEILITMATPWASRHRRLRPVFYEQQGKYLNRLLSS